VKFRGDCKINIEYLLVSSYTLYYILGQIIFFMCKKLPIIFFLIIFIYECDHGLEPPTGSTSDITGISGLISYNNWPAADSLFELRLVVFKNYPPTNIVAELLNQQAFVYPALADSSLPYFVDTTSFILELTADTYEYIVIAQQYGPDLYVDWRVVGQYDTDLDPLPSSVTVENGKLLENINVNVDFANPPNQVF
jgi:hypothetical protein